MPATPIQTMGLNIRDLPQYAVRKGIREGQIILFQPKTSIYWFLFVGSLFVIN